ncbi:hypothetical protein T440DRAFT_257241 [Plenodomus tracheiphilus IPT5]|uniref:Peptide N-acetyl-beta-D-glucosaminyl asparaginase amidase A N-terminal domain-containing protein n=1 Tax=Plenodomus tracheiphilus IPT5 TaxID=1408161 RepID=A0A6A7AR31_9PLEO|nr:hypothetical protein T440DRAFT_257241 [Plenodomus tracheiphilus IPT5]
MYIEERRSFAKPMWLTTMKMRQLPTPVAVTKGSLHVLSNLLLLIIFAQSVVALSTPAKHHNPVKPRLSRAANDSSLLECLQVAPPILTPAGECQQTLMTHTFAYSYGQPFVGIYSPAACDFNRVTIKFTVTSAGRQFDRLALMYLGDTEVFRTSTAEPTRSGIVWTYAKDMSAYTSLFRSPQKIIFDLGNVVDDTYTGLWNTTLTATFFTAENDIEPADLIIPVSARKSADDAASAFIVPGTQAINIFSVPQNVKKAVFSVSACGQAAEEFWWSNVLTSDTNAFGNDTTLYGHSAFREIQVLIDGHLAGIAWPFPVIFTGGIVPGFWRPIVGIDAFDLREDEIDITPFIPMLSDGQDHSFEIKVLGVDDDGQGNLNGEGTVESNWVVTGKVFLWLDSDSTITTGTSPIVSAPKPSIKLQSARQTTANGTISSLNYSIEVTRNLYIESTLVTSTGPETVYWRQDLAFSNIGVLSNQGNDQIVRQTTKGTDEAKSSYARSFRYPLQVTSSYNAPTGGNLTINANMDRAKISQQLGDLAFPNEWKTFDYTRLPAVMEPVFSGSSINNWQKGTASYLSVPAEKKSYGAGSTEQLFVLNGVDSAPIAMVQGGTHGDGTAGPQQNEELYRRHIKATNDSVVFDEELLGGEAQAQHNIITSAFSTKINEDGLHEFAKKGVRAQLGRGPY